MGIARVVIAFALVVAACNANAGSPSSSREPSSTTSTSLTTSTTISIPTTTVSPRSHDVGLFRVDPATLTPIAGTEPITTGDWITGYGSPNGEWLGLDTFVEPDTSVFQVIEVATGTTVTEKHGGLWPVGVGNDGVVYSYSDLTYAGSRFRKLAH